MLELKLESINYSNTLIWMIERYYEKVAAKEVGQLICIDSAVIIFFLNM